MERRQGALVFQSSIPNYSMLQTHHVRSQEDGASALSDDPSTPHNSIVQISTEDASKKMPVGFYVDLNDIDEASKSEQPQANTKKNIFSLVIDFDEPKRDMPSKFKIKLALKIIFALSTRLVLRTYVCV